MAGFGFEMIIWLFKKIVLKIKSFLKKRYLLLYSFTKILFNYIFFRSCVHWQSQLLPRQQKGLLFPRIQICFWSSLLINHKSQQHSDVIVFYVTSHQHTSSDVIVYFDIIVSRCVTHRKNLIFRDKLELCLCRIYCYWVFLVSHTRIICENMLSLHRFSLKTVYFQLKSSELVV